ncbi:hypothetical protein [Pseudoxanthomonas koreensis]|uniref:hypothetical protein n=1 Tax=Pseudoxanthomonas koreensis TaxID=266061 RepID=UPI001391EC83|nr:hypothetical protein [Pseudoxanthomonas koreensis]KAF1689451.1 hypothetical protein CSC64_12715 [Pseudoxanthomonas koreensis]
MIARILSSLAFAFALACPLPALAGNDISKVNGSIEATAGTSYGDLDTVNGAVRIGEGAQVREASTVNGSITVGDGASVGSLETVNGSIRLGRNVQVAKDIETVNGSVFVDQGGKVGGDVETVNGAIGLVRTELRGGIETVNGDITVGVGSRVGGGITIERSHGWFNTGKKRKPRVVVGPDAVVEGPLKFEREVTLYVHRSARTGPVTGAEAVVFDTETAPQD